MHMTCLIAGENYEEQLAPFQENNMGDCSEDFLDIYSYTVYTDVNGEKCFDCLDFNNEEEAKEYCESKGVEFNPADGFWSNSQAKWDWYQVGGRWNGYFIKKTDGYGKKGTAGLFTTQDPDPNKVDIVRKGDIDMDAMALEFDGDMAKLMNFMRPYAFIKDGEMIEKHDFANVEEYEKEFDLWWESLPDDEIIVAIDYHM